MQPRRGGPKSIGHRGRVGEKIVRSLPDENRPGEEPEWRSQVYIAEQVVRRFCRSTIVGQDFGKAEIVLRWHFVTATGSGRISEFSNVEGPREGWVFSDRVLSLVCLFIFCRVLRRFLQRCPNAVALSQRLSDDKLLIFRDPGSPSRKGNETKTPCVSEVIIHPNHHHLTFGEPGSLGYANGMVCFLTKF